MSSSVSNTSVSGWTHEARILIRSADGIDLIAKKNMNPKAKDKLIVALDVDSATQALELFVTLRDVVGMFKIGSQLFTAAGPELVKQIIGRGGRIFLDLKFHDIPNTVAAAGIEAARLGVSIFNIHAAGGVEMMKRTAAAVTEVSEREGLTRPGVIAVTVLTSMDHESLEQIGFREAPGSLVVRLARSALACGLDGVVASPMELAAIRQAISTPEFLIVAPGIRSSSDASDDQKRTLTAAAAISAGADYLVVGRPVLTAADPLAAANALVTEIGDALDQLSEPT
jgi:orotidine-5'-phosphate decarboxylase